MKSILIIDKEPSEADIASQIIANDNDQCSSIYDAADVSKLIDSGKDSAEDSGNVEDGDNSNDCYCCESGKEDSDVDSAIVSPAECEQSLVSSIEVERPSSIDIRIVDVILKNSTDRLLKNLPSLVEDALLERSRLASRKEETSGSVSMENVSACGEKECCSNTSKNISRHRTLRRKAAFRSEIKPCCDSQTYRRRRSHTVVETETEMRQVQRNTRLKRGKMIVMSDRIKKNSSFNKRGQSDSFRSKHAGVTNKPSLIRRAAVKKGDCCARKIGKLRRFESSSCYDSSDSSSDNVDKKENRLGNNAEFVRLRRYSCSEIYDDFKKLSIACGNNEVSSQINSDAINRQNEAVQLPFTQINNTTISLHCIPRIESDVKNNQNVEATSETVRESVECKVIPDVIPIRPPRRKKVNENPELDKKIIGLSVSRTENAEPSLLSNVTDKVKVDQKSSPKKPERSINIEYSVPAAVTNTTIRKNSFTKTSLRLDLSRNDFGNEDTKIKPDEMGTPSSNLRNGVSNVNLGHRSYESCTDDARPKTNSKYKIIKNRFTTLARTKSGNNLCDPPTSPKNLPKSQNKTSPNREHSPVTKTLERGGRVLEVST